MSSRAHDLWRPWVNRAANLLLMADQSTQSITVEAPAADVMAVIADFPAYPQWVAAAKKVEVLETGADGRATRVHFVLDQGAVKDDYVLAYTWEGDRAVTWTLVQGQMQKRQDGSYTLVEKDGRTEVTYSITIDLSIPMLGMIKRKAEKVILDTALKELKKRVEG
jgi:ribosome-associated toxin RatA of RatAB toxin-antitoxin module